MILHAKETCRRSCRIPAANSFSRTVNDDGLDVPEGNVAGIFLTLTSQRMTGRTEESHRILMRMA
jgi:hypothetical protein